MVSKKSINSTVVGSVVAVIVIGFVMMNYTPMGGISGETKSFDIVSFQWGFEPQFIEVNKGDHVTLNLKTDDVPHGIAIEEYQINEPIMIEKDGKLEFVADKPGTFEFYCSIPCGAGHAEQGGFLIVRDPSEPETKLLTSIKSDGGIIVDGIVDEKWNKVSETIFPTVYVHENREVKAKSLNDGERIYFLLRWYDDDANDNGTTETDRIALGFDISGDSDIAMGAAGVPHIKIPQRTIGDGVVDIWHWKAFDSHTESPNVIDDEFAGPFEQLKDHYYRDDDNNQGGENDLIATGVYDMNAKEWTVEISRLLVTGDTDVPGFGMTDKQFAVGNEYKIGFAIWDGGQGETAGEHAVTDWGVLKID
ncbi:Nitrous-oxide reductase protein [Marine Group I thaumarchaeote SCGC AAA799-P11]|uniref:Nitrous-oxide reductase protein n=1 Tax=Marine Group I thaumarchaeote SCGC AAA799-P11 TaxID=1502295 RepID=A0A087S1V8_9ARCH|nr:Nitrous-oxide reductase protein [Marine Group I thaumarchaeote SCGC AAA799-P11]